MAYDQNALPYTLRPIHIARTPADESRLITPVILPSSNPLPREVPTGSPGTVPVYYPSTAPAVPDSGYVGLGYGNVVPGVVNWLPPMPPPGAAAMVPGYGYANRTSLAPTGYNPNLVRSGGSNASDRASEESGDDLVSGRNVKFLCSYGGKILPRPSDGVLRYVGGDTRIISVRRDVGFNELMQKMFDLYGRDVVIKYQLPGEDLDALVGVSRLDDLENMMDEYDKMVERSTDGSAKLRVFLFSDLESSSVIRFKDLQDSGQKYMEAVNAVGDSFSVVGGGVGVSGGITWKGSIASASSTQNSEVSGAEGGADGLSHYQGEVVGLAFGGVASPGGSSATGVPAAKPVTVPASPSQSDHEVEILERTVPVIPVHVHQHRQFGYDLLPLGPTIEPPGHVQTYVDPHHETFSHTEYVQMRPPPTQMGYQSQIMGSIGPVYAPQLHNNTIGIGVPRHQFVTPSSDVSFNPDPVLVPALAPASFNPNSVPAPVPALVPVQASFNPSSVPVPIPPLAPVQASFNPSSVPVPIPPLAPVQASFNPNSVPVPVPALAPVQASFNPNSVPVPVPALAPVQASFNPNSVPVPVPALAPVQASFNPNSAPVPVPALAPVQASFNPNSVPVSVPALAPVQTSFNPNSVPVPVPDMAPVQASFNPNSVPAPAPVQASFNPSSVPVPVPDLAPVQTSFNPNSVPVPVPVPALAPVQASFNPNSVPIPVPALAPVQAQPPALAQYAQQEVVQIPCDPSYSTYQPQPQLKTQTQIPSHVIPGTYGWNQIPCPEQVPFSETWVPTQQLIYPKPVPRFDGCIMCQKALPHAHSDTVAQDRKESPKSTVSDVNPVYQCVKIEDTRRMMQPNRIPASDPSTQVSTPFGVLAQQSAVQMPYQANLEPVVNNKIVSGEPNPVGLPLPSSDIQVNESPQEYPANFPLIVTKEDNIRQIDARMEDLRLCTQDEILESRPMTLEKSQMVVDPNYTASDVPWLHGFPGPVGTGNLDSNDTGPAFSGGDSARLIEGNLPASEWINAYPLQFDPKSEVETIDPLNPFNGAVVETKK